MGIQFFLERHGIIYKIERCLKVISAETGLKNMDSGTNREYISFLPEVRIERGDTLIDPSGKKFYVVDTEIEHFNKIPQQIKAYYETDADKVNKNNSPVFNITNAYGSVIGTANTATINYNSQISELKNAVDNDNSPDKAELEKIIALLEMVINNQVPPSKGLFSKFSAVMERHSWLSSSVAATFLSWLTTNALQ